MTNRIPEIILEGRRNDTLTRLAGAMRRIGASERTILGALLLENEEKCRPPLEPGEVRMIARSMMRYRPAPSLSNGVTGPFGIPYGKELTDEEIVLVCLDALLREGILSYSPMARMSILLSLIPADARPTRMPS